MVTAKMTNAVKTTTRCRTYLKQLNSKMTSFPGRLVNQPRGELAFHFTLFPNLSVYKTNGEAHLDTSLTPELPCPSLEVQHGATKAIDDAIAL